MESIEKYEIIAKVGPDALLKEEAMLCTKYKIVVKEILSCSRIEAGPPGSWTGRTGCFTSVSKKVSNIDR